MFIPLTEIRNLTTSPSQNPLEYETLYGYRKDITLEKQYRISNISLRRMHHDINVRTSYSLIYMEFDIFVNILLYCHRFNYNANTRVTSTTEFTLPQYLFKGLKT